LSTSAIQDDDDDLLKRDSSNNSSRRSSSTSAPPGVIYGGGGGAGGANRKVIRSHLDASARLHAIDFPMQFNFGSPYGASVSIMFDDQ